MCGGLFPDRAGRLGSARGVGPAWIDQSPWHHAAPRRQANQDRRPGGNPDTHRGSRTERVGVPAARWFRTNPRRSCLGDDVQRGVRLSLDWLLSANALDILDKFTAAHDGNAGDVSRYQRQFSNDTECVNGPRVTRRPLIKEVVPF